MFNYSFEFNRSDTLLFVFSCSGQTGRGYRCSQRCGPEHIHSFIHSFNFVHSFIHSSIRPFIRLLFACSFVCSSMCVWLKIPCTGGLFLDPYILLLLCSHDLWWFMVRCCKVSTLSQLSSANQLFMNAHTQCSVFTEQGFDRQVMTMLPPGR